MASRSARTKKPMLSQTPPTPPMPPVFEYREFDPDALSAEIAQEATRIRATVEQYENAKTVSQRVLDAHICV